MTAVICCAFTVGMFLRSFRLVGSDVFFALAHCVVSISLTKLLPCESRLTSHRASLLDCTSQTGTTIPGIIAPEREVTSSNVKVSVSGEGISLTTFQRLAAAVQQPFDYAHRKESLAEGSTFTLKNSNNLLAI